MKHEYAFFPQANWIKRKTIRETICQRGVENILFFKVLKSHQTLPGMLIQIMDILKG